MLALLILGCAEDVEHTAVHDGAAPDVTHTHLALDLSALTGSAEVSVKSTGSAAWLDATGLGVSSVKLDGKPVQPRDVDGWLVVPASPGEHEIAVEYTFQSHPDFSGWMANRDVSFVWPTFCGNLFPCNPDVADGMTFSMEVSGTREGEVAVFPAEVASDAPPYMPAVAVGDYTETALGTTRAGTDLRVWWLPGGEDDALQGTKNLVAGFDFLERTYGPYPFGSTAGTVSVNWGDIGGMEHHPYWHVASWSMRSEEVHIHEAAHAWFGSGVRFACWEDFTLSEGTTSYIAARALTAAGGPDLLPTYVAELDGICAPGSKSNTIAMPGTCGEIDIQTDPLWSMVPYMKGACWYADLAHLLGPEVVDGVIAAFYEQYVGEAVELEDMIAALRAEVPEADLAEFDSRTAAWLTELE